MIFFLFNTTVQGFLPTSPYMFQYLNFVYLLIRSPILFFFIYFRLWTSSSVWMLCYDWAWIYTIACCLLILASCAVKNKWSSILLYKALLKNCRVPFCQYLIQHFRLYRRHFHYVISISATFLFNYTFTEKHDLRLHQFSLMLANFWCWEDLKPV